MVYFYFKYGKIKVKTKGRVNMVLQLTKEELNKLHEQLDELKLVKRPAVIERLQIARSYGDLSENSEYDAARDEQMFIEKEIKDIEEKIRVAEIIDTNLIDKDIVSIGKRVTVKESDTKNTVTYDIVGVTAVDAFTYKISKESPIGQALDNRKVGDIVTVQTPEPKERYQLTIKKIELVK